MTPLSLCSFHCVWLAALGTLTLLTALAPPGHASSLYRRVDEEGVTHFTNAPTDPRFQRVGALSGTAQGWLRLPMPYEPATAKRSVRSPPATA
jgi:hypothetical protein